MQAMPFRLKARRTPLIERPGLGPEEGGWSTSLLPSNRRLLRRGRALRRGLIVFLFTLPCLLIQAALLKIPGRGRVWFARFYWGSLCWLIGLRVRRIGVPPKGLAGRPVVYVSNHSSWLDILVLGGKLEACFISRADLAGWPMIGLIAKLGRTVFVRRERASTIRERDDMQARLAGGDSLILFPEGTTSDGSRVLPFRSSFLSIAELPVTADGKPPLVQPVSVVYDRLSGLPIGRASRPLFAWYGDMNIGEHFWRLAQHRGMRATVLLHNPLDPAAFASRKELAQAVWAAVADGAASLRQNRPVQPMSVATPAPAASV